jgi:WD40 repeat protein
MQATSSTAARDTVEERAEEPRPSDAGRYDAFVSYAREDSEFVTGRVCAALRDRGKNVWIDVDITGGATWRERVKRGIEACKAFIFVISGASVRSEACRQELDDAVALNKLIIPVVYRDDYERPLPSALADAEWVLLRSADDPALGMARLVEALDSDLPWRDSHTRLAGRAREWLDSDRDGAYLLRGSDLRDAESWLSQQEGHLVAPTREQSEYIVRSRQAAGRRLYTLVGGLAVGLAIAVGLSIFALIQRSQARHQAAVAQSRQFAAQAEAVLGTNPENAISLSAKAVNAEHTPQAIHALWHALQASRLRLQLTTPSPVSTVAFSPDGQRLAIGTDDGAVRLWQLGEKRILWSVGRGELPATSMSFSRDGQLLAVARDDAATRGSGCSVDVLRASDGAMERILDGRRATCQRFVGFVGRTRTLAIGDSSGTVRLIDANNGDRLTTITSLRIPAGRLVTNGFALTVGFSADGHLAASAGNDDVVRVVALPSGRPVARISSPNLLKPDVLAFSPNDQNVLIGSKYTTEIANLEFRGLNLDLPGQLGSTRGVAWSPDRRLVAAATGSGETDVWSAASGRSVESLAGASSQAPTSVAFSSTGMLAGGSQDGSVRVWAPDPDLPLRRIPLQGGGFGAEAAPRLHLSAIGEPADGIVLTNDQGQLIKRLTLHGDSGFAVGQDGYLAFTRKGRLVVLSLPSGRQVHSWALPSHNPAYSVAVSARGDVAAVLSEHGALAVFSSRGRFTAKVPTVEGFLPPLVTLSPDARLIAITGATKPAGVRLLRTADLKTIRTEPGAAAAFSPSGTLLAVQRPDNSIDILRTSDWGVTSIIRGGSTAFGLGFSPDGRLLAATGEDGVLRVWDAADGTLLTTRVVTETDSLTEGSEMGLSPPVLTAAGYALVAANFSGSVEAFDVCPGCLSPSVLLAHAKTRLLEIRPVHAS